MPESLFCLALGKRYLKLIEERPDLRLCRPLLRRKTEGPVAGSLRHLVALAVGAGGMRAVIQFDQGDDFKRAAGANHVIHNLAIELRPYCPALLLEQSAIHRQERGE